MRYDLREDLLMYLYFSRGHSGESDRCKGCDSDGAMVLESFQIQQKVCLS